MNKLQKMIHASHSLIHTGDDAGCDGLVVVDAKAFNKLAKAVDFNKPSSQGEIYESVMRDFFKNATKEELKEWEAIAEANPSNKDKNCEY